MSNKLDSYPGLKALVEATGISADALLPTSLLQTVLNQLAVSVGRKGRMELAELIGKTVRLRPSVWPSYRESADMAVLRSELICEFEKQGLSTEDALAVAEMFLELVREEERDEK